MRAQLNITLVQTEIIWEDIAANLTMLDAKLAAVSETDLIVLPEMFSTGFSMNTSLAETMNGSAIQWMKKIAQEKSCVVTGSLMIEEENKFYNRLIWMRPDGSLENYDKRHLFSLSEEPKHYTAGNKLLVTELKGWKFLPLICFDLRFPVWSRNVHNYDAIIYVANWPQKRSLAWKTLLQARAIENQCYVIGLNRVGNDGNGIYHSGDSAIINAEGSYLYHKSDWEDISTITLDKSAMTTTRRKFPFLDEKDFFEIKP
jgi:predicted amidohydrolase